MSPRGRRRFAPSISQCCVAALIFLRFYSFNPPRAARNWVNQYVAVEREDALDASLRLIRLFRLNGWESSSLWRRSTSRP